MIFVMIVLQKTTKSMAISMNNYTTIFRQILQLIPANIVNRAVKKYCGDRYVKHFKTFQLLVVMVYAQITGKKSLRDIETGLLSQKNKLYHLGVKQPKRSNLSHACKNRDCRIFEEIYYSLYAHFTANSRSSKFNLKVPVYALDSTKINLCLKLFPWAKYRRKKGAMKLHNLLDLNNGIPAFMVMTDAKIHDMKAAWEFELPISPDSILTMDRGYVDYEWFNKLNNEGIFFVTRAKVNIDYKLVKRDTPVYPDDEGKILSDDIIELTGVQAQKKYDGKLRVIIVYDKIKDKVIEILTNNFSLSASVIGEIYRSRWDIEEFFRWIKQNLKISNFFGTSENAVMLQVWSAMIYYLLLFYMSVQMKPDFGFLELSRRICASLFEAKHLLELLSLHFPPPEKNNGYGIQMTFL